MSTFTGKPIEVSLEDDSSETVTVKQIRVRDYDAAFAKSENEVALAALATGKPEDWVLSLAPESFELLNTTVREVNEKGFFSYCERQNQKLTARLNSVKPETLQMAMEAARKPSTTFVPGLQPR